MAYADGQLDAAASSRIAEHLQSCGECLSAVTKTKRMTQQMLTWTIDGPTDQLNKSVLAELRSSRSGGARRQESPGWWARHRVWAYGAAAALIEVTCFIQ